MTIWHDAGLLAQAQLRTEARARVPLTSALTLGSLGLLLVGLAAGPDVARLRALGPGLVWLGVLYGAIALADHGQTVLDENDAHSGVWLCVADCRALFLGSVSALAVTLAGLVVSLILLAGVLMNLDFPLVAWPVVGVVVVVGSLGAAAVSALVASLVARSPQRAFLGPVLLLPLLAPTMLAGSGALGALAVADISTAVGWIVILAAEAALFVGTGLLTYEAAAAPE